MYSYARVFLQLMLCCHAFAIRIDDLKFPSNPNTPTDKQVTYISLFRTVTNPHDPETVLGITNCDYGFRFSQPFISKPSIN